ncbi:MAG: hypothetical protein QOE26_2767 [Verrucomicrobiota bacterium]|jgi:hypothetical protein
MKTKPTTSRVIRLAFYAVITAFVLAIPGNGWATDNTGAMPKYSSSNENQVNAASKDIGSGVQANLVYAYDYGAGWTTASGIAGARFTSADQSAAVASVTSAPTSGQKLVITDLIISVDTAMRVDFSVESASGTVIESVYMAANSTVNLITRGKRKLATADKKLQVRTSVAGNISVNAFYYSEL